MTLNNLAILYSRTQRLTEAERSWNESLSILRELVATNADAYRPKLALALQNLGRLHRDSGRAIEAEHCLVEARSIYCQLVPEHPEAYLAAFALTLDSLALLYQLQQRLPEALKTTEELLLIYRDLFRIDPEGYRFSLSQGLSHFGSLCSDCGRERDAEAAYKEAIAISREPQESSAGHADIWNNLANLYLSTKRMDRAEEAYLEALKIYQNVASDQVCADPLGYALLLGNLANFYEENGRLNEAMKQCLEAEAILEGLWNVSRSVALADRMAATLFMHARLSKAIHPTANEHRLIAARALNLAVHPSMKQVIQEFIEDKNT